MAQTLDLSGPVVRGAASFQKNCRRRMLSEETGHLDAREPAPLSHAPGLVRNRDLENRLCQVHRDSRRIVHGLLLSEVSDDLRCDAGTMMPLTSREESISSLQRTRRPRLRSGRSLRSLGSPLNAQPLGGPDTLFTDAPG